MTRVGVAALAVALALPAAVTVAGVSGANHTTPAAPITHDPQVLRPGWQRLDRREARIMGLPRGRDWTRCVVSVDDSDWVFCPDGYAEEVS